MEALGLLMTFFGGWVLALWALTQPGGSLELLLWPTAASRFVLIPTAVIYLSLVLSWPRGFVQRATTGLACLLIATGILSDYHLSPQQPVDWASFAAIPPGWQLQVEPTGR